MEQATPVTTNESAPQFLKDIIEKGEAKVSKKNKSITGRRLREKLNLERLKGIVNGTKLRKNEFVITPLEMVYDHNKCSVCLEPATHVETMSLDPHYKRHLCSECVRKGK